MSNAESMPGAIVAKPTPNPNARKFVLPGVSFGASRNFSAERTADDPLAAALLAVDGVYNVLLSQDFVTINKVPHIEWHPLEAAVHAILSDYLAGRIK
jgi:hypothetical protein